MEKVGVLRAEGRDIVAPDGQKVYLHGVNLGGWLMMEGYILGGRNIAETAFKDRFCRTHGPGRLEEFNRIFRENFINEGDFRRIRGMGFNCIRLPFNYRLVEDRPFHYSEQGVGYLDRAVEWAEKNGLYIILDLHAAPGSQNKDWHSDSDGRSLLWEDATYVDRTCSLWRFIADRYKDRGCVAGYDLVNEPVTGKQELTGFYKRLISCIRDVDREHMLFLEGNFFAQHIDFFDPSWDRNSSYSVHTYHPLEFTFNFIRGLVYPGVINGVNWDAALLKKLIGPYHEISREHRVPVLVGEFGINSRCFSCGAEYRWLKDILDIFRDYGFHWTYWTYKAVAGGIYPDGILQMQDNPGWLTREAVDFGWERLCMPDSEAELAQFYKSMHTDNFKELDELSGTLGRYL